MNLNSKVQKTGKTMGPPQQVTIQTQKQNSGMMEIESPLQLRQKQAKQTAIKRDKEGKGKRKK